METWKSGPSAGRPTTFRRPAPDVYDDGLAVIIAVAGGPEKREARLLVTRDRLRLDAEAPLQVVAELGPVFGIPHRARGQSHDALRAEPVAHLPVDGDRLRHPVNRLLRKPAAGVDALPKPRDERTPVELHDLTVLDLGHEQPRGVRPDVDDRDGHARQRTRARSCALVSRPG